MSTIFARIAQRTLTGAVPKFPMVISTSLDTESSRKSDRCCHPHSLKVSTDKTPIREEKTTVMRSVLFI